MKGKKPLKSVVLGMQQHNTGHSPLHEAVARNLGDDHQDHVSTGVSLSEYHLLKASKNAGKNSHYQTSSWPK
jgi:hypothetical protein